MLRLKMLLLRCSLQHMIRWMVDLHTSTVMNVESVRANGTGQARPAAAARASGMSAATAASAPAITAAARASLAGSGLSCV